MHSLFFYTSLSIHHNIIKVLCAPVLSIVIWKWGFVISKVQHVTHSSTNCPIGKIEGGFWIMLFHEPHLLFCGLYFKPLSCFPLSWSKFSILLFTSIALQVMENLKQLVSEVQFVCVLVCVTVCVLLAGHPWGHCVDESPANCNGHYANIE